LLGRGQKKPGQQADCSAGGQGECQDAGDVQMCSQIVVDIRSHAGVHRQLWGAGKSTSDKKFNARRIGARPRQRGAPGPLRPGKGCCSLEGVPAASIGPAMWRVVLVGPLAGLVSEEWCRGRWGVAGYRGDH
jgi:hypothetical protein